MQDLRNAYCRIRDRFLTQAGKPSILGPVAYQDLKVASTNFTMPSSTP